MNANRWLRTPGPGLLTRSLASGIETVKKTYGNIAFMDPSRMKIVVFGSFHAGKSTFISAIDPDSRHVDTDCADGTTTVALDFGRVVINNRQIHLYGTPGQERFGFARQVIMRGMDAAILLVDCTCAVDEFTRQLFEDLSNTGIPLGVVMNKCDLSESCPAMVRRALPGAHTYEISARDPVSARNALDQFVGMVTTGT